MQTTPCCLVFFCVSKVSNSLSPIKKRNCKLDGKRSIRDLNPGLSGDSPEMYPLDHDGLMKVMIDFYKMKLVIFFS